MKVYVDELPECCNDCELGYFYDCQYCSLRPDLMRKDEWCEKEKHCPLKTTQSLKQQVRKEVCDKIREWHDEECESLDLDSDFDVGYSGALSNLWGILDQIQGETKNAETKNL